MRRAYAADVPSTCRTPSTCYISGKWCAPLAGRGTGRVRGQAGQVGLLADVVGTGSAALAALRDAAARTRGVLSLAFYRVPFVRATPSSVTNCLRYYDKASMPLLVGKTEVDAVQGAALFKLRITSLSSHRDKQCFRIRISPTDTSLLLREPGLSVVTTGVRRWGTSHYAARSRLWRVPSASAGKGARS